MQADWGNEWEGHLHVPALSALAARAAAAAAAEAAGEVG